MPTKIDAQQSIKYEIRNQLARQNKILHAKFPIENEK